MNCEFNESALTSFDFETGDWFTVEFLQERQSSDGFSSEADFILLDQRISEENQILERVSQRRQLGVLRPLAEHVVRHVEHAKLLHHLDALHLVDLVVADPQFFQRVGHHLDSGETLDDIPAQSQDLQMLHLWTENYAVNLVGRQTQLLGILEHVQIESHFLDRRELEGKLHVLSFCEWNAFVPRLPLLECTRNRRDFGHCCRGGAGAWKNVSRFADKLRNADCDLLTKLKVHRLIFQLFFLFSKISPLGITD